MEDSFGLVELILVFVLVLVFALYQIRSARKGLEDARRKERSDGPG